MLFLIKIIDILSISLSTNVDQTPQGFFWERGKTLFYYFLLMVQYPFTNPLNFWKRMRPTPEVFRESGKTFFLLFPVNDTISVNIQRNNALIKFLWLRGMICSVLLKHQTQSGQTIGECLNKKWKAERYAILIMNTPLLVRTVFWGVFFIHMYPAGKCILWIWVQEVLHFQDRTCIAISISFKYIFLRL